MKEQFRVWWKNWLFKHRKNRQTADTPDFPKKACFCFTAAAISDAGPVRERNEDHYMVAGAINCNPCREEIAIELARPYWVAGVFDGIGGGSEGEAASRMMAEGLRQAVSLEFRSKWELEAEVRAAFQKTNNQIVERLGPDACGGTTATILCVADAEWKLFHMGDSRAYLLNHEGLARLTRDQTVAQMKIDTLGLSNRESIAEKDYHTLTAYVGQDRTCHLLKPVETPWNPLEEGCSFFLSTDGLHDSCSAEEICAELRETVDPGESLRRLVARAIENGSTDNITCLHICQR